MHTTRHILPHTRPPTHPDPHLLCCECLGPLCFLCLCLGLSCLPCLLLLLSLDASKRSGLGSGQLSSGVGGTSTRLLCGLCLLLCLDLLVSWLFGLLFCYCVGVKKSEECERSECVQRHRQSEAVVGYRMPPTQHCCHSYSPFNPATTPSQQQQPAPPAILTRAALSASSCFFAAAAACCLAWASAAAEAACVCGATTEATATTTTAAA